MTVTVKNARSLHVDEHREGWTIRIVVGALLENVVNLVQVAQNKDTLPQDVEVYHIP
jgi:hypothetical protein